MKVTIPPYLPETEVVAKDIRRMYSNIIEMDRHVGRILRQLEEDGLLESTIIVWYTDHGGPLPRQKRLLYDSGLNVPMMIRFPNQDRAGSIDDRLISFVDFAPTLLSMTGIEIPEYIQGQAFEGMKKSPQPRRFIHAAADRFDEAYDQIRAVRDKRFKYLKNFNPDQAYYLPLEYRERMATMQELLRLRDAGKLNEAQAQWFRDSKPVEELFDLQDDPHELNNLVDDPAYATELAQLRAECERWMQAIDDKGAIPEITLIEQFWPDKKQPVTAVPTIKVLDGKVKITCATEGATIGYKWSKEKSVAQGWSIYKKPLDVPKDDLLYIISHRIGYAPSDTLVVDNTILVESK